MPKEKRVDEFGAMGSYNGRIAFNAMHKKYIITEVLSFPRYVFYNALGLAKIRANLQMSVVGMIPVDYNDALNIPVDTCRFGGRLAKVNDGMCQPPPPVRPESARVSSSALAPLSRGHGLSVNTTPCR